VVNNEGQFRRLCLEVLDLPELLERPEFATNDLRNQHVQELTKLIGARTSTSTGENRCRRQ